MEFDVPTLDVAELYAGKFVAALDRQHPRDLFDVWRLFETGGVPRLLRRLEKSGAQQSCVAP
jgi:predicted nucleotidyltransferase component of viral defense system